MEQGSAKAAVSKRKRRKKRLRAAGKTCAVRPYGKEEAEFREEGEAEEVSNHFHLGLSQQFLLWMDPGQSQPSGHNHCII